MPVKLLLNCDGTQLIDSDKLKSFSEDNIRDRHLNLR